MIAIIDYGMGNLRSVQKGFEKVGVSAVIVDKPAAVAGAGPHWHETCLQLRAPMVYPNAGLEARPDRQEP